MPFKFKVAVLGAAGYIGSPYRNEIRECPDQAEIVGLCGRRLDRLKACAAEDGDVFFSDDWQAVLDRDGLNLVLVCTPDAFHYEAVMECARRGIHVLCEKPVGINAAEAKQMLDAYVDKRLAHFVPFWTRYADAFRKNEIAG